MQILYEEFTDNAKMLFKSDCFPIFLHNILKTFEFILK